MYDCVLFISPNARDARTISRMLGSVSLNLDHASSLRDASSQLRRHDYAAILTEACLPDGSWKDVLSFSEELHTSCPVVVTDRIADDLFWAEVLNLGAYDLLVQPFDTSEVQRILTSASLQARFTPQTQARALPVSA